MYEDQQAVQRPGRNPATTKRVHGAGRTAKRADEVGKAGTPLAEIEAKLERRLRSLTPPTAFATRWDTALDALRARAELVADAGDAAAAGDRATFVKRFQRFARQGTVGSRALGDYGFEVCGQ